MPDRARTRRRAARLTALVTLAALTACGNMPSQQPSAGSTAPSTTTSAKSPSASTLPTSRSPTSTASSTSTTSSPSSTTPSDPGTGCQALAQKMSRSQRIGQLFMVAADSQQFSSSATADVRDRHIGSVILMGNSTIGASATEQLTDRIRSGAGSSSGVKTLIATDQEGGTVQRLQGSGFDRIPSAVTQGQWSDATLRSRAQRWAGQLKQAGVDADLAPVADVVPTSIGTANQPIGALRRQYGSSPDRVAVKVAAFVDGMQAGKVATSVKHFPGLGRVRGNTDFQANVRDTTTTRSDADLAGFRSGISAGTDMVMISSAVYTKIDSQRPATFSTTVITNLLRGDLGFDGVVISDDLAGRALSSTASAQRAVRFVAAGGDLAIMTQGAEVPAMIAAVAGKAEASKDFDEQVSAAATRVLIMKARYGLADCG